MITLQMFLSIAQNCIETHEEVAIAVSFMIIFNKGGGTQHIPIRGGQSKKF